MVNGSEDRRRKSEVHQPVADRSRSGGEEIIINGEL